MAEADTLSVVAEESLDSHDGMLHDEVTDELKKSPGVLYFCRECASSLWSADPRWLH